MTILDYQLFIRFCITKFLAICSACDFELKALLNINVADSSMQGFKSDVGIARRMFDRFAKV
jgi:hypothetical protein